MTRSGGQVILALCAAGSVFLAGCTAASNPQTDDEIRAVTTTGILADFVRQVGGERVKVSQLIPDGADPHSYEPSLRAVRDVAYADIAFTNYLLLEQHSIIRTLDANLAPTSTSVSIAEEAAKDGANILPLVEDRSLDTAWLGMRVAGTGEALGLTRSSEVDLSTISLDGPGQAAAYLTTTFGAPDIAFSSHDGFDAGTGYRSDTMTLPADAHTHLSWGFSKPGIYRVKVQASARATSDARPHTINGAELVFAVGVNAAEEAKRSGRTVFAAGHGDLTVDLDAEKIVLQTDTQLDDHTPVTQRHPMAGLTYYQYDLENVIVEVPTRTLTAIPGTSGYRFLGQPGQEIYILPQAVLGKHVHGDIDPHLWHDIHNAAAYVRVIRDKLVEIDPEGADGYRQRAQNYLDILENTDAKVSALLKDIPENRRQLVTTHDAYGYLANAYGLKVAGFVAPHPGAEPSIKDRQRLAATLRDLDIPAVFLEPQLAKGRSTVATIARESGVKVCPLYGDTLDTGAPTYVDMMLFNARSLHDCLH